MLKENCISTYHTCDETYPDLARVSLTLLLAPLRLPPYPTGQGGAGGAVNSLTIA